MPAPGSRRSVSVSPLPVDERRSCERLRLTAVSLAGACWACPRWRWRSCVLSIPLALLSGSASPRLAVVPATERLTALHRRVSGGAARRGDPERVRRHDAAPRGYPAAPLAARPGPLARRRVLWFSATGGFVLVAAAGGAADRAGRPPARACSTAALVVAAWCCSTGRCWSPGGASRPHWSGPGRWPSATSSATPGWSSSSSGSRRCRGSRAETLDHSAAEVRRIERDLHDGAQAQIDRGRHERRTRREADRDRPRGRGRAAARGPGDHG